MNADTFSQFFSKKAYEISYAAFRIGSALSIKSFTDQIFEQAFSFLNFAVQGKYSESQKVAESMEYLLRLGGDAGIVNHRNVQTMTYEIGQFNSAIAEYKKAMNEPPSINIEESFSKMPVFSAQTKEHSSDLTFPKFPIEKNENTAIYEEPIVQKETTQIFAKSAMRQSAILELIRQNINCRLKDIQDSLPDVSERTIRYDLQDLIERGLIERIGSGGPSTYYRIPQLGGGGEVVQRV